MKKVLKNYRSFVILIGGIILGIIAGIIFKERVTFLKPFGDLFLNLLLTIIVPLIFLTISTSIGKMKKTKRLGKLLISIFSVLIITSLVSVALGLFSTKSIQLVDSSNGQKIKESLTINETQTNVEDVNYLDRTVQAISVNDFQGLLSKNNMIALIIFSILFGMAINMSKEKGEKLLEVLDSANEVVQKLIKIFMYYAPIGLGCYVAALIGSYGADIAIGYTKTFVVYTVTAIIFYLLVYSIYAYIAGGKKGFKAYWKNILPVTITAFATCSSAASIPINIKCTKDMGVNEDIVNTTVPLGTSFHKDGSIIGSCFKIMFLIYLFNANVSALTVILVALVATLLVSAVPIGGGTISELMIITMLGFPVAALPILSIIATIIDAPATVLNAVGNSASSMLVSRIVDGKDWLKN
jgi:Na+/H+-dicarboxylate symporter